MITEEISEGLADVFNDVQESYAGANLDPWLDDLQTRLEAHHAEHFHTETDPSGESYVPLAESTAQKKGHDLILREFGDLYNSLAATSTDAVRQRASDLDGAEFIFGTADFKAPYHQSGTDRMPARPPVGVSEFFCDELAKDTGDFFIDVLRES